MNKLIQLIVLATLCFILKGYAQTGTIRGQISIGPPESPLPGATIRIRNTPSVTSTDKNGNFALTTTLTAGMLLISYTGYQTTEIPFKIPAPAIRIILKEDKGQLEDIVVIGYGETTRKLNTGSVAAISAKQIADQPVMNVLSALSGRMPGVFVQTTNGLPGGNINVQIRGKGSILAGTDPLYIVDGVPYENSPPNRSNDQQVTGYIGGTVSPLNNLNPSDIESITVLKDADATSIYGSRGTNGVVLIQTKRNKGDKTDLNINLNHGLSVLAQKPSLMNLEEYLSLRREAFANSGRTPSADPASIDYAPDLVQWDQNRSTDWSDYVVGGTARSTDLQARISSGGKTTSFSLSGNYRRDGTITIGENRFERGGISASLITRSADERFTMNLTGQLSSISSDLANTASSTGASITLPPNYPVYLADGGYNWVTLSNIDASALATAKNRTGSQTGNLSLIYKPIENLNIKLSGGYTQSRYGQRLINPSRSLRPGLINNSVFGTNLSSSVIFEPQADYSIKKGRSRLNLLFGGTYQDRSSERELLQLGNYKLESLMEDFASAGTVDVRQRTDLCYRYVSAFARATYTLSDTYILNATVRRDGSSRFGPGNRFGNFGSIGGAVIISNLSFIKQSLPFLSFAKLRGSYGSTGNDQIGDYQYLSTYSSPGTNLYQGTATLAPNRISNENFRWEITYKSDIGLELGFWEDRMMLSADYYSNRSGNQLVLYTLPASTGFNSYQANLPAEVLNRGWEFSLSAEVLKSSRLKWRSNFNLTLPKNRLRSFENLATSSYALVYEIGYDISRISGYRYLGPDPQTGAARYAGQDGNPSASPYRYFTLGKLTPDLYGGWGNSLELGKMELEVFLQFVKSESRGGLTSTPGRTAYNTYQLLEDRWSPQNPGALFPRASLATDNQMSLSSLNLFDSSYLRLKNISLSYRFGERASGKLGLRSLRIYAQAQNLLTLWNRSAALLDPESSSISAASTPTLRSVSMGIQINL
jgi:TonB-linked SusC/RagA family outer membrane protein